MGRRWLVLAGAAALWLGLTANAGQRPPSVRAGRAPIALPTTVDNSTSAYFPPIGNQGTMRSSGAFAATYYLMTYQTAKLRGWTASDSSLTTKFSPKFTYNLLNAGADTGVTPAAVHQLLLKHGAPFWSSWPYRGDANVPRNYLEWPTTAAVWREAIGYRMESAGTIGALDTDNGRLALRQWLAGGDLVNVDSPFGSWVTERLSNDPSTSADDRLSGQLACSYVDGVAGTQTLTLVGYDDEVWIDINRNGVVDAGEKGAFKAANSLGSTYGNAGFVWIAYDALRTVTQVAGAPTAASRSAAFPAPAAWCLARASYEPTLLGQITMSSARRSELAVQLGVGPVGSASPTVLWQPAALQNAGGARAFDGGTLAIDGTFVFDLSEIAPLTVGRNRYFALVDDNAAGAAATVSGFRIVDLAHSGATADAANLPLTADNSTATALVDYSPLTLAFVQNPGTTVAGATLGPQLRIEVRDRAGALVTDYSGSVTIALSANPGATTLLGTTIRPAYQGLAVFDNLHLDKTASGYTLTANAANCDPATTLPFDIVPGAAARLNWAVPPANTYAASLLAPAVELDVVDALGNRCTSVAGTVSVGLLGGDPTAVLSGTKTQTLVAGWASFANLQIDKIGTGYTLEATTTGLPVTTSVAFDILLNTGLSLVFQTMPQPTSAGQVMTPALTIAEVDAGGNVVTTDSTTQISLAFAPGGNPTGALLGGTLTRTLVNGIATFDDLAIDKPGSGYLLAATAIGLVPGRSPSFYVPAPAARLHFIATPTTVLAGAVITPTVQVELLDENGSRSIGDNVTQVTLALDTGPNPAGAPLLGTLARTAVQGVVTFDDLAVQQAGRGYRLLATSGTLAPTASSPFSVTAGQAVSAAFEQQPVTTQAGMAIPVTVRLLDAYGNLASGDNATVVALTLDPTANPSGVTLLGTLSRTCVAGKALFGDLRVNTAVESLRLIATPGLLAPITSNPFNITRGAATRLVFTQQPTATLTLSRMAPAVVVEVQDVLGNRNTDDNTTLVTLALGPAADGTTLGGTLTKAVVAGVATFDDLSLDRVGVGLLLQATATGFEPVDSDPFDVVMRTPLKTRSTLTVTPAVIGADGQDTAVVTVVLRDAYNIAVQGATPEMRTVVLSPATGVNVVDGGGVSDGDGTFTIQLRGARVGHYNLFVTVGDLSFEPAALAVHDVFRYTFDAGLRFLGLPLLPLDQRPRAVLGTSAWRLARYASDTNSFAEFTSTDNENEAFWFAPGRGQFVRFNTRVALRVIGTAPPAGAFGITLKRGWNTVANPFATELVWNLAQVRVLANGSETTLADETIWESVAPYVWTFDGTRNRLVFDPARAGFASVASRIPPLSGFWVYSNVDHAVLLVGGTQTARAATAPGARDWTLRLEATNGGVQGGAAVGVSTQVSRALSIAAPPSPGQDAALVQVIAADGRALDGEVRPGSADAQQWELQVTAAAPGAVALAWPGCARDLPTGKVAELFDRQTGRTIVLNTAAGYTYQAARAGEVRRLRLTVRTGRLERADITAMGTAPTRGGGMSVALTLSGPAQVGLTVRGVGGRAVRVCAAATSSGGNVTLNWDGLDDQGRRVPAGTYVLEAQATAPDGAVSRATRTVVWR